LLLALLGLLAGTVLAQSLYKYEGPDGEWVFTDRQPVGAEDIEVRKLARGEPDPHVSVYHRFEGAEIQLYGRNDYHAPVQLILGLSELREIVAPEAGQSLKFVVPARGEILLLSLGIAHGAREPYIAYRYQYLLGDPNAVHRPTEAYRAPFAAARTHPISQAYPLALTHNTQDSAYAVDIAMPVGTDIYAARGGTVIDVASTNYRASVDGIGEGAEANIVRILHEDGTFAIYAHLNWNGIRVKAGDTVTRGQYIADSGNTGFSSGPHLHFVVLRNADMRLESVPVVFEGPSGSSVVPETGVELVAY